MIGDYYSEVIERVYGHVTDDGCHVVMVSYTNEFSIGHLDAIKKYSGKNRGKFFAWRDFEPGKLTSAYEPFLDVVCDMYRKYGDGDFSRFLEECNVYLPHRQVLLGYYETGVCERDEGVLLQEVTYEQDRMTKAMAEMLCRLSEKHPFIVVINRFQWAAGSTLSLVRELLGRPSAHIGIVLGINDSCAGQGISAETGWDDLTEKIEEMGQFYHIGSAQHVTDDDDVADSAPVDFEAEMRDAANMYYLLDYAQAREYFQRMEHKIKFEDITISDADKVRLFLAYAKTSILFGEMFKALELVAEISKIPVESEKTSVQFECKYISAVCYMYQGKLNLAQVHASAVRNLAEREHNEKHEFMAREIAAEVQMSGWYNIFFCVQDIPIDDWLIEKAREYGWLNHLAHIYLYAYDNLPGVVAKAYHNEEELKYFSKGLTLAREIGNSDLVYNAFQKNIMVASTNGMSEVAILYLVRTYQFLDDHNTLYGGRAFGGLGYNLSAIGHNDQAKAFYTRALDVFTRLHLPEDVAETYYNQGINSIMLHEYEDAEHDLQMAMKIIDKLHLNSLRVCNLSKLYGLLALVYILQGDRFNCERYIANCRQFLNYVIERENETGNADIVHDYAKCDDDMFLYTFSNALLLWRDGELDSAFNQMGQAEIFMENAEGNQFFVYAIYRKARIELFSRMGKEELCSEERELLEKKQREMKEKSSDDDIRRILGEIDVDDIKERRHVSEKDVENLIRQEALQKDYQNLRSQMDFISSWQKIVDVREGGVHDLVDAALSVFLNHFNLDHAVYIGFEDGEAQVLYNDTEVEVNDIVLDVLRRAVREYPQGFAVSKIRESFLEHHDIISCFGIDDVCSFVIVPFSKNGELTSVLLTYVLMKDNWHGSIERYMLGDDDLRFYQLLFRELEYSMNRMRANEKIFEMNKKLQAAAVTDVLTGIYNRAGMYEEIHKMEKSLEESGQSRQVGLMFVDLDNFKSYNDTFGHDVGDIILKEMARVFTDVSRGHGFVSRYGGDEFIILLDTGDRDELESLAKEIYAKIEATDGFRSRIEDYLGDKIEVDETRKITCSIGIASAPDVRGEDGINELIRRADDLLYSVKMTEKGRYAFL